MIENVKGVKLNMMYNNVDLEEILRSRYLMLTSHWKLEVFSFETAKIPVIKTV